MRHRPAALTLLVIALLALFVIVVRTATGNYWDRLAWCETRGQWHQHGSYYVGGLGIYHGNWERWAPRVGVNKPAYLATREEQIRVAMYGRRVDQAYWGCMRIVGMPW